MLGVNFIRKIICTLRCIKEVYAVGGICNVNISYVDYGNCLKDKKILITGGGSGIGLAIAKKCLDCGAEVVIIGRNVDKLASACKSLGGKNIHYIGWDVSDISVLHSKLISCKELLGGRIDVLVNNAGISPSKFWGDVDEKEWDSIYSINLKGSYFLSQEITKLWRSEPNHPIKKIVNISSQGGFVGATYPYRMTKWDLRGLTEGLGKLLVKDNILVNAIAPGVVKTGMQKMAEGQSDDNFYCTQNPAQRYCLPEEIAELTVFLLNDSSNFIVGQTIVCDGGYILK